MPELVVERIGRKWHLRWGDRACHLFPREALLISRLLLQPEYPVHRLLLLRAIYPDGIISACRPRDLIHRQVYKVRQALATLGWPGTIVREDKRGYYLHRYFDVFPSHASFCENACTPNNDSANPFTGGP
jgi:DNA-binding winged helix-turn-helix (wHTH) protein